MPAKTKTTSQARKLNNKAKHKWLYGTLTVLIIAIIGVVIVRFSNASSFNYSGVITANYSGVVTIQSYNAGAKAGKYTYVPIKRDSNGLVIYQDVNDKRCIYLTPNNVGAVGTKVNVTNSLCFK